MPQNTHQDERRSLERICWECEARLIPLSLEPRSPRLGMHHVKGRNISEGGLQVCTQAALAIKSRLLVEMEAPEHPGGIQAVGSVVWISPGHDADRWCIGIEFSDIGDSAASCIRALLHRQDERDAG